jgi:hypothetical protein
MQTTISEVGQKKKGSVLPDEKAMSLKGRWFQVKKEEEATTSVDPSEVVKRNTIFQDSIGCYRVLSLYAKSYSKWRFEEEIDLKQKVKFKAHIQRLTYLHFRYHETCTYEVKDKLDTFIGIF